MRLKLIGLAATVLSLSACMTVPTINTNDPQAVSASTTVKHDNFKKITIYVGPNALSDPVYDNVFLRASKIQSTGEILYQIYVKDYYSGSWRFYNSAYDSNGNRLETNVIGREVGSCTSNGCSHEEHLGLKVSREYLEKSQDSGINFKISGKAGEEIFFIPGAYIKGFLSVAK